MKLLNFLFLFLTLNTYGQVTVSLGTPTGSGSTNVLLSTSTTTNRYSRTISVYTAAEIITAGGSAGPILSLAWDKSGTGEYTTNDAYIKVSLKHVTNTMWGTAPVPDWNTEIVGATDVFISSTYSIPTGTGWKTVPFSTSFVWNGVDNIAVFVEWDRSSAPTASINWGRSTNTDANATRVGSTSLAALTMLVNDNRPLLQLTFMPVPITSIDVNTVGSVAPVINTNAGTLPMEATILPATAFQAVTWSIVPVTGSASISTTGVVTAIADGTVWAKAVSVQDATKADSMQITISNQVIPVTDVTVATQGGVPAQITVNSGTLQMESTILPATALQDVTWSLVPGTGTATISTTGLVTAQTNGTVWAKAVSVQDPTKADSLEITISNQIVPITDIMIATQGGAPAQITVNAGTLQMESVILPATALQDVSWSVVPGTGTATVSTAGLVTAQTNGTVWAKAVSVQDPTKADSLEITISNQGTGIAGLQQPAGLKIYPNPVVGHALHIEVEVPLAPDAELTIMEAATGRILKAQQIKTAKFTVDLNGWAPGVYSMRWKSGPYSNTTNFVLE
jgi:hypothetical protein